MFSIGIIAIDIDVTGMRGHEHYCISLCCLGFSSFPDVSKNRCVTSLVDSKMDYVMSRTPRSRRPSV